MAQLRQSWWLYQRKLEEQNWDEQQDEMMTHHSAATNLRLPSPLSLPLYPNPPELWSI